MRQMRRKEKKMDNQRALELLEGAAYGVLAMFDGESAYAVPVNYVHCGGNIYVHGANEGHKIDAIGACSKVCLTVTGDCEVRPEEFYMDYESVLAFGTASLLSGKRERDDALRLLCQKYCAGMDDKIEAEISKDYPGLAVIKIALTHISGKTTRNKLHAPTTRHDE